MKPHNRLGAKAWVSKHNFLALPGKEPTHTMLDGGLLHVPMTSSNNFHELLAEDLDNGVNNFIVEYRTPVFKMFADLDILEDNPISDSRLHGWFCDIQSVMKDIFGKACPAPADESGQDDLRVIVCQAPIKTREKNKQFYAKTGVHLIWPNVFVDSETALFVRSAWIQYFENKYGMRHAVNIWEDVFDRSVYEKNGLRMVGSSKLENCTSCNGKPSKTVTCPIDQCDGTGKYDINHVYRIHDVLDRECRSGRESKLRGGKDSAAKLYKGCKIVKRHQPGTPLERKIKSYFEIQNTSIREKNGCVITKHEQPDWFDDSFFQDEIDNHKSVFKPTPTERKFRRGLLESAAENVAGAAREGISRLPRLPKNDSRVHVIQQWLKKHDLPETHRLPDVYRNTEVVDVTMRNGENYPYFFVRTDSLFCLNKGGEHSHNNIYFLINERGMYQKCFCQCETTEGRKFGMCRDYKSSPYQIPDAVLKELYPEMSMEQYKSEHLRFNGNLDETLKNDDEFDVMTRIKELELVRRGEKLTSVKEKKQEKKFNSKRRISEKNF